MDQDKHQMTDPGLIHLVRANDPSGLSFVYEKYRNEFLHWIRRYSRCSDEEAREYYQAAIVILYENIMSARLSELQSSLKTYLFAIGKNLSLQAHRREKRQERVRADYMLEVHLTSSEEDFLRRDTDLSLISRCLAAIGDPCQKLLDLFYFHQKSMEEISMELGYKNPETAKNQKYKCMERLRKMVEGEHPANYSVIGEQ